MNPTKFIACMLLTASAALAASVGDTYDQVISEKGNPKSRIDAGSMRVLNYPDMTIKIRDGVVVSIKPVAASPAPEQPQNAAPDNSTGQAQEPSARITALKQQRAVAVSRVTNIVNQAVATVPRTDTMRLTNWGPIWFHPGATRPDFANVDIRATQEMPYDKFDYVTSDFTPDVGFPGNQLEFNAMTKYFYTDRTIPKKKLTEDEMLEINRLYRVIGKCDAELSQLGVAPPP
jgi:hypothetical protein